MNRFEAIVAIAGILAGCATAISIAFSIAWAVRKRNTGTIDHAGGEALREIQGRIERIEQGIEAIAVEVERVSEGQRFAARLLSEQRGESLPR